ncbi:MAG: hypothetical protein LBP59_16205 [Planctomycetaceae bacterium]|nr:hypothetical protein [Planctomycetaceae bacterium]
MNSLRYAAFNPLVDLRSKNVILLGLINATCKPLVLEIPVIAACIACRLLIAIQTFMFCGAGILSAGRIRLVD